MTADVLAPLAADWGALIDRYDATLCRTVGALIDAHAESLAERFYQHMGDDSHAGQFLAHQRVEEHLKPSMRRWLQEMFALRNRSDVPELIELQKRIGEIHARVDIPISLVMRGARFLKAAIFLQLGSARLGRAQLDAITFVSENIDIALEVMSQAYSLAHQRNARSEEAYRMFSVSQNIGTERERQRAGLLDWENQLMYDIALGAQAGQLQPLLQSDFGLWFKHKATHAFQDAVEMSAIREHVDRIERCIAHFQPEVGKLRQLRELRESTRVVRYLLDTLFARAGELEVGRDSLTQMLNRKFLSVVLNREIALARTTHSPFAVLMVDIDHFKSVNDNLGHEAGDLVLQQVAAILSSCIRGGDYAFRYGGEEFLLILVDTTEATAMTLAERVRRRVAEEVFQLAANRTIRTTVSLGVALHDGHPDFQRTLRRADQALYQAKNEGRDRVVLACD
ncbi:MULTISPECIES: diguanylate cyclase [Pseudomonas]|uniref:diguanylate cyclase n=1 Tax=Pseudomonas TaxID=286 RepID=UPI00249CF206|nr:MULTISPECIES: diguanylate cyclase [Pseudomonas]